MKRYIVMKGGTTSNKKVIYYAYGVIPGAQYRRESKDYYSVGANSMMNPTVFFDSALFQINTSLTTPYIFECEISENQPDPEEIVENSNTGVALAVYNENGVLVCDNGVVYDPSGERTPAITDGPGEML